MKVFTNDEMNLMCIYNGDSRKETIAAIEEMKGWLEPDERELFSLADSTLHKLRNMTDDDYAGMELFPDFGDEEETDAE